MSHEIGKECKVIFTSRATYRSLNTQSIRKWFVGKSRGWAALLDRSKRGSGASKSDDKYGNSLHGKLKLLCNAKGWAYFQVQTVHPYRVRDRLGKMRLEDKDRRPRINRSLARTGRFAIVRTRSRRHKTISDSVIIVTNARKWKFFSWQLHAHIKQS